MRIRLLALVVGVGLCLSVPARAGMFTVYSYDGDSTSRVSTQYTYTHTIDLGGGSTTPINGVTFVHDSAANRVTYQYDVVGANSSATSSSDNVTGSIHDMESRYIYDSQPKGEVTVKLEGLTIGYTYTTTFYDIGGGSAGTQDTTVRDGDGTVFTYDESSRGPGDGTLLTDTFTATSTVYTYTFEEASLSDSPFRLYGFSNQVATPEPSTFALLGIGSVLLTGYAWKRRRKMAA
jgi:hypothetical protein